MYILTCKHTPIATYTQRCIHALESDSLALLEIETEDILPPLSLLDVEAVDIFFDTLIRPDVGLTNRVLTSEITHWPTLYQSWTVKVSPKARQMTLKAEGI